MKKGNFKELIDSIPDGADIVISKCFVIDEKDEITGILDVPIVGTAYNDKENEFRFVLSLEDVKECFQPKDVKFFDNPQRID